MSKGVTQSSSLFSHLLPKALLSDRIAIFFPPNFNTKWILDLNEHNYIDKYQKEIDPLDDDDNNKDEWSPHENALVLAPRSSVLYWSPSRPCLAFFPTLVKKKKLLSCFSAIFLYKISKLLGAQASPPKEVLKIQPKLLNQEPANYFCKRLNG